MFSDGGIYGSTVPELTPVNTEILSISCTDNDATPFGSPHITTESLDSIPFELIENGIGRAQVVVSRHLSGPNTYIINTTCSDGERQDSGQFFLFVPEPLAPVFLSPAYEWFVSETAGTGTVFRSIQATSNFSDVTYSIADGNSDDTFYIDPSSGLLSLVVTLDYEVQRRHGLIIRAVDEANRESNVLLLVQVLDANDEVPLIPPSALLSVRQNQLPGYPLGAVQCIDADDNINNTVFNYTFNTPSRQFSVDEVGVIRLEVELDDTPVYVLPVTCFDVRDPQHNSTGIVTIEVEFVNQHTPTFQFATYQFHIPEDLPALSPLGQHLVATDLDIGSFSQLVYTIQNDQNQFFIDSVSGTIGLLTSLDREIQDQFTLAVAATDGGPSASEDSRMTGTATVVVRVLDANDNSPAPDQMTYVQSINTSHTVGSPVLVANCSDPDLGSNGTVDYSLDPPDILDHFIIQSDGTILLAQQQPNQAIHTFFSVCSDRGSPSRSSSALVTVIVNFIALNAPVFDAEQYNATILENTTVTTFIVRVQATPSDASITVIYEIAGGNDRNRFFLNSLTGDLSVRNPLDARERQNYTLSVRAGNEGSEQLFSLTTVSIFVVDINDNSPVFESQFYTSTVIEGASLPTPVILVVCTDSDLNSDITYSLTRGVGSPQVFNITQNGAVYVVGELNYESVTGYSLQVTCSDGGSEPRSAVAIVRLDVSPVNEFRPQFTRDEYVFQAMENDFGALIGRVSASDGDNGFHGSVTYMLQDPGNFSVIFVDPTTGDVHVSHNLDYELQPFWNLTVIAVDGGGLESVALLNVEVINLNDAFPELFPETSVLTLAYDELAGFPVQSYVCRDPDGSTTSIYILSGNSVGYFDLNLNNVLFWTGQASNLLSNAIVSLTLQCQDTEDSGQYDESIIAVSINVTDAVPPSFSEDTYSIFLFEDTMINTIVLIVSALAENEMVVYTLVSTPIGFTFSIDPVAGNITLIRPLNRETESFYSFFVSATDPITLGIGLALVEVNVIDINDNPPVILPSMQSVRLSENFTSFTAPFTFFTCTDSDTGSNDDISFQITSGNRLFSINTNGQVFLVQPLDYELITEYTLEITCSDSLVSPLTDTATLQIQVTSFNEHSPVFSRPQYFFFISEVELTGTRVGRVIASDGDDGLDGSISYSIISSSNTFIVDDTSGELLLGRPVDFEQQDQYLVFIEARDNAQEVVLRKSSTAMVVIDIVQVNEHTPSCLRVIYMTIINATSQGIVIEFSCVDSDSGPDGQLQYIILGGNEEAYFTAELDSLIIPTPFSPVSGAEEFRLHILVRDMGLPSRNVTIEAILYYSFDNLASPDFDQPSYVISIPELARVGTVVTTLTATDSDPSIQGQITYSVVGSENFRIDSINGNLFLASPLDWETAPYLSFGVIAQDSDPFFPLSDVAIVNVTVINDNDNLPQCDRSIYTSQILSNATRGENVLTLNCRDLDRNPLRYSIESEFTAFQINSTSGRVFVADRVISDFTYLFEVQVSGDDDEHINISISITVLFANSETPSFLQAPYIFFVPESSPVLTTVGRVLAIDSDSDTADLTYSLVENGVGEFYVHPTSGDVVLTRPLDYEVVQHYSFTVQVMDAGSFDGSNVLSRSATVIISIINTNDNQPMFIGGGIYGSTVPEITPVGTDILMISCTDNDDTPYGVPSIAGEAFEEVPFELTEISTGVAVVNVSRQLLGEATYFINVTCSDGAEQSVEGLIFIFIPEPQAPNFTQSAYEWSLSELAEIGTAFTDIRAMSDDSSTITYSIADGNTNNIFTIDQGSGVISIVKSLDFEAQSQYGLIVTATDEADRVSNVLLLVHVLDANDEVPLIPPSALLSIRQNDVPGYLLGAIQCIDADDNINNTVFNYTFNSPSRQFSIDEVGIIRLEVELDDTPVYVLPVTCFDVRDPQHNSTGIVTVEVEFVNLYIPTFQLSIYPFQIPEDLPALSPLGQPVLATDLDIGSFSQLVYTIQNDQNQFFIDSVSGTIGLLTSLDREIQDQFTLAVAATDGGPSASEDSRMTGTATVVVRVLDANDNSPAPDQMTYVQSINTNHTVGSPVLVANCSDPDLGSNGTVDYSLDPPDILDHFIIQSDGTILLAQQQPNQAIHTFFAVCSDRGSPSRSSSALVTVIVNFIALNAPVFDAEQYNATILENTTVTTSILRVQATPSDASITVIYEIAGGNDRNRFFLNSLTGDLSVRNPLDVREQQNYVLSVRAGNEGSDQLFSLTTVSIFVVDINDNSPVFESQFYTSTVMENASLSTPVISVVCTDSDLNSDVTYSLTVGTTSLPVFNITQNGTIYIVGELDYESVTGYSLQVTCSDGGSEPRSAVATVRLDVSPVNEFRPQFTRDEYVFEATENDFGALIGRVSASDGDNGVHGSVTYLLQDPGNFSVIFVDPTTGDVHVSHNLDYELQPFWNLTVIAVDGGGLESVALLNVEVVNVNDVLPIIEPQTSVQNISVSEDRNTPIQSYTCTDADGSDTTTSITNGNSGGYFRLDDDIVIWTGRASNMSTNLIVSLTLRCQDNQAPDQYDESIIAISIIVTESVAPLFSESIYSISLPENTTINSTVLVVSAIGENEVLIYSFINLPFGFPFSIEPSEGRITLASTLNSEIESFFSFLVTATDRIAGTTGLSFVEVRVIDVNDNPPVIIPSMQFVILPEHFLLGSSFASFLCTDDDSGDNANVAFDILSGDDRNTFSINDDGFVSLSQPLDFEAVTNFTLEIICRDSAESPLFDTARLNIIVEGVNEYQPFFTNITYSFSISEYARSGDTVGMVSASDLDRGLDGQIRYSVISGNGQQYFSLSSTGFIRTSILPLNATRFHDLQLNVRATDGGGLHSDTAVIIRLVDVNEPPQFSGFGNYFVRSSTGVSAGTTIFTFTCYDIDTGNNSNVNIEISSIPALLDLHLFTASRTSAQDAHLIADSTLPAGSYEIIVACSDSGNPPIVSTTSITLRVESLNTPPTFVQNVTSPVVEEDIALGTSILSVNATDAETDVIYSISGGTGLGTFQIDSTTGMVQVILPLDYETVTHYTLIISASDLSQSNPMSTSIETSVLVTNANDIHPVLSPGGQQIITLLETSPLMAHVQSYTCFDMDGSRTTLSISTEDQLFPFSISTSGEIFLVAALDYEVATRHNIIVTCTDEEVRQGEGTTLETSSNLTIVVLPVNIYAPIFTSEPSFNVTETASIGSVIATVEAVDADVRGPVTFSSITTGPFLISSNGSIQLQQPLDYETSTNHMVMVIASDNDNTINLVRPRTASALVTINVIDANDNQPVCDRNVIAVSFETGDYSNHSILLTRLNCSDRDDGLNSLLRYSIVEVTLPVLPNGNFIVNNTSGELLFQGSILASGSMVLRIIVQDSGSPTLMTSVDVAVQIIDTNVTRPRFNISVFQIEISENQLSPSIIFDGRNIRTNFINPHNDAVEYSLQQSMEYNGIFIIDLITADVSLTDNNLIDYDNGRRQYVLTLEARVNQALETAIIEVNILDYNDNIPRFARSLYNASVLENQVLGTYVLTVEATDIDSERNGNVQYSIVSGNFPFAIDSTSGNITTVQVFDRESIERYTIFVLAIDMGNPSLTGTSAVTISIGDENDRPPFFIDSLYIVSINNTVRPGQNIITLGAQDEDTTGTLTFQINNEGVRALFLIDSNGNLRLKSTGLPQEHLPRYNFTVEVSDGIMTDVATVIIYVVSVTSDTVLFSENDRHQFYDVRQFLSQTFNLSSETSYTIFQGDPLNKFEISSSGILSPRDSLDRENISRFELGIRVVDNVNIDLEVTIIVLDQNDNRPMFTSNDYYFNISEGHYQNSIAIGSVTATDQNEPGRSASILEYSIITPVDQFTISQRTGEILVKDGAVLDREKMDNLTFVVEARDFGEPEPLSATVFVVIHLEDINDNDPEFVPLSTLEYRVLLSGDKIQPNTRLDKIRLLLPLGFENEVTMITVSDPDTTSTLTASIEGGGAKSKFGFTDPHSMKLELITTEDITKEDFGTVLQIVLRDQPIGEENSPVIRNITFLGPDDFFQQPTTKGLESESPVFFQTEAGIAVLVVICLMIVALGFGLFCLVCFVGTRREKDPLKERFRTTTIAQRVLTEVDRKGRKKSRKAWDYNYQDSTHLEFPDLSPEDYGTDVLYPPGLQKDYSFMGDPFAQDQGREHKEPFIPIPGDEFGEPLTDYTDDDMNSPLMNSRANHFNQETETSALSSFFDDSLPSCSESALAEYTMGPVLRAMLGEWEKGDEILSKKKRKRKISQEQPNLV